MTIGGWNQYGYGVNQAYGTDFAKGMSAAAAPVRTEENGKQAQSSSRASSPEECQTCKNRKYKDGSDENVSFKSAAHISPEASASRVMAHEAEHVANAYTRAAKMGGKVVQASVSLHTQVCPECGRTYVAGGETRTMITYRNEDNPYQKMKKAQDAILLKGANIDVAA